MRRQHTREPLGVRPIVTLTSDFGLSDAYVATMKAAIIRVCPAARLIDVTHQVPRRDILCGSITLERAVCGFPPGTIHLAVVDPGVGTDRRLIVAQVNRQMIVCPDNGLITWSWRVHGGGKVHEITWRPRSASATFHGRDILAPVVGQLAKGAAIETLARAIGDPVLLEDLAPARREARSGRVIHVDHFGNATTNVPHEVLKDSPAMTVKVKNKTLGRIRRTYCDVAPGTALALIGSSGLLEIAVRDGSARDDLNLKVGDEIQLR